MKPLRDYNLIGISGKIGSGKDTAALFIRQLSGWQYENRKFAAKLKQIAGILTNVEPSLFEQQEFKKQPIGDDWGDMTYRELLQKLGTEAMRDGLHNNVWVNALFADFLPESKWIITDVRFPNEAEAIRQKGGTVIRIVRLGTDAGTHPSETALDDYPFDRYLINHTTIEDFKNCLTALYHGN